MPDYRGRYRPLLHRPMTWRRKYRRAFLATFPISLPLWLVACVIKVFVVMAKEMGSGIAKVWNNPSKRITSEY